MKTGSNKSFKDVMVFEDLNELMVRNSQTHDLDFMMLCIRGTATICYNETCYSLSKWDLFFSPASRKSELSNQSADFKYIIYAVDTVMLSDILYACLKEEYGWVDKLRFILKNPVIRLDERKFRLINSYRNLVTYYTVELGFYKKRIAFLQAQAIIFELLSWVDEAMMKMPGEWGEIGGNKAYDWYWQFRKLLVDNVMEQHTVAWYADKMGITPAYLHQVCTQVSEKSPQSIISHILLQEAKRLLFVTDMPIKEIAYTLHFSSESNFCKFFKRMVNISPANYRVKEQKH